MLELSGADIISWFVLLPLLVPACRVGCLYRTRFGSAAARGRRKSTAPSIPRASRCTGLRYRAMIISGALCGVAGTYLSVAASSGFVRDMTAGKGYHGLWPRLIFGKMAAVSDARGLPIFLLAFTDALRRPASRRLHCLWSVLTPVQFILALPYVLDRFAAGRFVGRAVV